MFKVPEEFRVLCGLLKSSKKNGNNGAFIIQTPRFKKPLFCIASDGMGWEHVSVSLSDRCPTWREMCFIKDLFWDEEDCVVQFHPPKSMYVNNHKYCLHLWRKIGSEFELPDSILVGVK